jgi:hypothetical protein
MQTRKELIDYINSIVNDLGSFKVADVDGENDIFLKGNRDSQWMIDGVTCDFVNVTHYIHGYEVNYDSVDLDEIPMAVLEQVVVLVQEYEQQNV